jgi:carbonic anhydrase/acetyltransferase-like protein (isoleucine patch superfamily)
MLFPAGDRHKFLTLLHFNFTKRNMTFLSRFLRFILKGIGNVSSFLRVFQLNLLYPGAKIDYKTRIARGCSIVCVKGGTLEIFNSTVGQGTQIFADATASLCIRDSFIGRNCVITAKESVQIKSNCLIAEMVVIRDQDHLVDVNVTENSREQFQKAPVVIEENVWIASKATVLKGITIGKFSVIAASAVVVRDVPASEVWGGIPAKFIRQVNVQ